LICFQFSWRLRCLTVLVELIRELRIIPPRRDIGVSISLNRMGAYQSPCRLISIASGICS
jgi:hypothetical protein